MPSLVAKDRRTQMYAGTVVEGQAKNNVSTRSHCGSRGLVVGPLRGSVARRWTRLSSLFEAVWHAISICCAVIFFHVELVFCRVTLTDSTGLSLFRARLDGRGCHNQYQLVQNDCRFDVVQIFLN